MNVLKKSRVWSSLVSALFVFALGMLAGYGLHKSFNDISVHITELDVFSVVGNQGGFLRKSENETEDNELKFEDLAILEPCKPLVHYNTCSCETACSGLGISPPTNLIYQSTVKACATQQQKPVLGIRDCQYDRYGHQSPIVEGLFINLTFKTVMGIIYDETYPGYLEGVWPPDGHKSFTMIGVRRMENLQFLLEEAIRLNISGDFIETGVWRGGATIFAAGLFKAYGQMCPGQNCRKVFVVDSFEGIPAVNVKEFPADALHAGVDNDPLLKDNSMERVQQNFRRLGLLDDSIVWL